MSSKRKKMPDTVTYRHFIESVYHVVYFGNNIESFYNSLGSIGMKLNTDERRIVRLSIHSKILLDAVSFRDELTNYLFRYNSDNVVLSNRVESFKNITEPLFEKLDFWNDMRSFRNNVLAHNFRIDKNNFESVHLSNKLNDYNIPDSIVDLSILCQLLIVIANIAKQIFEDEYIEACQMIDFSTNSKDRVNEIDNEVSKLNLVLTEVNKRIKHYNCN